MKEDVLVIVGASGSLLLGTLPALSLDEERAMVADPSQPIWLTSAFLLLHPAIAVPVAPGNVTVVLQHVALRVPGLDHVYPSLLVKGAAFVVILNSEKRKPFDALIERALLAERQAKSGLTIPGSG